MQYTIERAVIMAENETLSANDLFFSPIEQNSATDVASDLTLDALERKTILQAIDKHHGNVTQAAKGLGITRTALYRRLNKYEL